MRGWKVAGAAGVLAAIVALATGATTTILTVNPNLVPSRERTVKIEKVKVEPGVTLKRYLSHRPVELVLAQPEVPQPKPSETVGVVISFQYSLHGFKTKENLPFRWTLFDGKTKLRLAESESIDPFPVYLFAEKTQADLGSWELWVNTTDIKAEKYFVRLEIYDAANRNRMTYEDSPIFSNSVR